MKTFQPKQKDIKRNWHLIDAKGMVLGRLSTEVVKLLMGKQKINYAPHIDMGDIVVVINAKEIELTGRKKSQKLYHRHTGYPGGLRTVKYTEMHATHPERILEIAVDGMLPKNRLRGPRMTRLKVYANDTHPYGERFGKSVKVEKEVVKEKDAKN